ncbi:hypothetical protein E2562_016526 [Oryza meyeriana var. granulata]|uniref:Uncharacterized protein n=1 Tax=Oryza meyeriana var. granulata TaxID=110450 RepID=A0A6G1C873_9ORYZ|nr:hypothetical protein E2562_016526 [Oryza meyeriana var. granulata]
MNGWEQKVPFVFSKTEIPLWECARAQERREEVDGGRAMGLTGGHDSADDLPSCELARPFVLPSTSCRSRTHAYR